MALQPPWRDIVEVTLGGTRRTGYADLFEETGAVARVYTVLLERVGVRDAQWLGLKVNVPLLSTHEESKDALVIGASSEYG